MQDGYLKISVSSANRLIPVSGAQIAVYEDGKIIAYRVSDKSGNTTPVVIPAPDKILSESPGNDKPYSTVDVQIRSKGYVPVKYNGVRVFAGETSIVNADMIPQAY